MELVIEDWYLQKEYQASGVWCHDKGSTGGYVSDFVEGQTSFRLVGTKEQIREWSDKQDFILDEVYSYEPLAKDSYWDGICCGTSKTPSRQEYNNKWRQDFEKYCELYKKNKNKLLIL